MAESAKAKLLGSEFFVSKKEVFKKIILAFSQEKRSGYVCVSNVHTTVMGVLDPEFQKVTNSASFAILDGMPLVWVFKFLGFQTAERIRGPTLMRELLDSGRKTGLKHYLYGGAPATLETLVTKLKTEFPGVNIAGYESPPFRKLTDEETASSIAKINNSGAEIVWVGLGAPKQEKWMFDHHSKIKAPLLGVGAAFDFLSGQVNEAPLWIQQMGLEWLFRFFQEPKRLWKRYFKYNSLFIYFVVRDFLNGNIWSTPAIRFRDATQTDLKQLLDWRNDQATIENSVQNKKVTLEEHTAWFEKSLQNKNRDILIAEAKVNFFWKKIGTVRYDTDPANKTTELSWTLSPQFRGRGLGFRMVNEATLRHSDKLICRIKDQNSSSLKIANKIGYTFLKREGDIQFFECNNQRGYD